MNINNKDTTRSQDVYKNQFIILLENACQSNLRANQSKRTPISVSINNQNNEFCEITIINSGCISTNPIYITESYFVYPIMFIISRDSSLKKAAIRSFRFEITTYDTNNKTAHEVTTKMITPETEDIFNGEEEISFTSISFEKLEHRYNHNFTNVTYEIPINNTDYKKIVYDMTFLYGVDIIFNGIYMKKLNSREYYNVDEFEPDLYYDDGILSFVVYIKDKENDSLDVNHHSFVNCREIINGGIHIDTIFRFVLDLIGGDFNRTKIFTINCNYNNLNLDRYNSVEDRFKTYEHKIIIDYVTISKKFQILMKNK